MNHSDRVLEEATKDNAAADSPNNSTPLHAAALNNSHTVAEILLKQGANVNAKDNCGQTPLRIAILNKATETVEVLRRYGGQEATKDNAAADSEPSAPKSKRIATMTLAETYIARGLTQKAIETYRELLEQEPNNTTIRSKLSSLEQSSNAH